MVKVQKELKEGEILNEEQFRKFVIDSGTVDQIDFSQWNARDCVSKDL